jgi:H+/gluconate symporter and related permeases
LATSLSQVTIFLITGIILIVIFTGYFKLPAFFALFIASIVVGLGLGYSFVQLINVLKEGFGNIMKSLGLIIIMGTTLGAILEHSGSTRVMSSFLLRMAGVKRVPLAMNLTGFIIGLPVFCDSGFIVLSGLNNSIAQKTKLPVIITSLALATGLYAVHCLIPPHPGITTAAINYGVDLGKLILIGLPVAFVASLAGYFWTIFCRRKMKLDEQTTEVWDESKDKPEVIIKAFLPVLIPVILIAARSFIQLNKSSAFLPHLMDAIGDPVIALSIGILLALLFKSNWNKMQVNQFLQESIEKAGSILVIIGAGGAFGNVLFNSGALKNLHLNNEMPLVITVLIIPYLLTVFLKTAQGSSTVAIITASALLQPILLHSGNNVNLQLLSILAMGAGSMMISHANDAYFWLISKFSIIDTRSMFKYYTLASIIMSVVSMVVIYFIYLIL